MLKREISYEDFDGEKVTDTYYFNLTRSEIIELEVAYKEGLQAALQRIVKSEDRQALIYEFKKIILMAYGERSEDGKRFVKNDAMREAFSQTAAYDSLFMELATDDKAASQFILGIIPKDFQGELEKAIPPQVEEIKG